MYLEDMYKKVEKIPKSSHKSTKKKTPVKVVTPKNVKPTKPINLKSIIKIPGSKTSESKHNKKVSFNMDHTNFTYFYGVDYENHRLYDAKLVGRKICAEYEGCGWYTGTIKYYNTKLEKYLLVFDDDSEDLITEDDINGTDMYLEDIGKKSKSVDDQCEENGLKLQNIEENPKSNKMSKKAKSVNHSAMEVDQFEENGLKVQNIEENPKSNKLGKKDESVDHSAMEMDHCEENGFKA